MTLLELYFSGRNLWWGRKAPRSTKKWRKGDPAEWIILPPADAKFLGRHELQSIHVRPGKLKGEIRDEIDGEIIFREFYFEGGDLVAVREYGWAVDFFLPSNAMVRWRNEIDATKVPFQRCEQVKAYTLQDTELMRIAEWIYQIAARDGEGCR